MSVRPRLTSSLHVVQPALALGHAEVRWDALPAAVQVEVLARWCEMLREVTLPHDGARTDANATETR